MPDPRSALKEFRQLDRKRLSEGLTAEEERRHAELRDLVEPELQASGSGFDVGAAADRLRASLEPAGLRRAPAEAPPAAPAAEAGPAPLFEDVAPDAGLAEAFEGQAFEALEVPAPDAPAWEAAAQPAAAEAAEGWDPEAPASDPDAAPAWDANAQPFDPNAAQAWDPSAQPFDPNAAQAWDPNAQPLDPNAAQGWDPNAQPYDPNAAQAWDANAQPFDPNAAQAWDPNAQPFDPNAAQAWDPNAQPYDPNAAQAWDPNAQPYDPNAAQAWDPNAQPYDPNAAQGWDPNAPPYDPNAAQAYDPNAQPYDPNSQPYDPNAAAWDPNATPYDPGAAQAWDPSAQPYDPDAAQPAWNPDTTATFGEPEAQPSAEAAPADGAPGYEAWTTPADEPETVDLATEAVIEELEPLSADGLALEGDPSAEPPAPLAGGDAASLPPDGWEVTAPPPDAPVAAVLGEYDEAGAAPAALSPEDLGAEPAPEPEAPGAPLELGEYDDTSGFAAPAAEGVLEVAPPGAAPAADAGWAEEVALDQGFELESGGSFDAAAEATVPEWAREAGLPPWDAPAPDALEAGSLGLDGDVEAPVEPAAEPIALGDEAGEDGEPIALEPTLDLGAPVEPTLELAELEEPAAGEAGASPGDDPFALRAPEPEPTGARDLSALDFAAGELGEDADAWAAAETAPGEPEPFTMGDVGPQAEPLAGPDPEAELPAWDAGAAPALELEPSRWDEAAAVDLVGGGAAIAAAEPSALLAEAAEALPPLELDGPAAPEPFADAEPAADAAASLTAAAGTLLDAGAEAPPAIDDLLGDLPAAPGADATEVAEVAEVADLAAMPPPDADDLPTLDGEDILEEIPADELVPLPPDEEAGGGVELGEVSLAPAPVSASVSAPAPAPAPEPAAEPEPAAVPAPPAAAAAIPDAAFEPLPVEEVSFTPPPAVEAAPAPAGAWQVPGAHRVVIHTLEGLVKRGLIEDAALDAPALDVVAQGPLPERIPTDKVKAIFFMLAPGEAAPAPEGKRVRVTFRDGRQVAGFSPDYREDGPGFFMIPADTRTSTARIWIYRSAVRQVAVS
ncbi:putative CheA signal transduction histidine kinase [Anaeromyxobacter dehalogenans 2CP-1]|uniref:CheA signal transduction histidine kinase n=1 Tax=Anaeromyxobacter dehalogenans (strain ATCC BAA-258 / DSM 21875 / 2CP-1) TaxID=455488 RepID=B8J7V0_ANAD2|nr:hypothetical protein [Anaeromyxobacter dehalogenans]ACL63442.1 putative CheA signal transduction histidine kinase [Anaeromyxobacter dehalogenans 2CP-1]